MDAVQRERGVEKRGRRVEEGVMVRGRSAMGESFKHHKLELMGRSESNRAYAYHEWGSRSHLFQMMLPALLVRLFIVRI